MAPQRNAGAGAEAERPEELPEYAGHYRLESCLGSGGMGVVHLARSTSGMKLAVKVVHAQFAKDPEFRGRFRQEVGAARRVSGAFTAPVVDADPEAERPWMATSFIPGPTLSEEVKRNGPMGPAQLRRLMAGLAEALRDIHRVGVVHRDLKPSNVLLAEDGPKVIDFGISRPADSELRTETGKLIGTPPFMAPEQFRRPREVGPAADVFALGSVLVHAARGRGPFDSDSPYVVAYQVVHDEPDLTDVPEELAPLVRRCLAKEPEERPTPDELMRELRSVAASYDTQTFTASRVAEANGPEQEPAAPKASAAPNTSGTPATSDSPGNPVRPARRRPVKWAALGGGALVAAVAAALVPLLSAGGDEAPRGGGPHQAVAARFTAWEAEPVGGQGMPQCSYGADALICARTGLVFALDPAEGRPLWRQHVDPVLRSTPPVLSAGLVQPVLDHGTGLRALDPASGETHWQRGDPAYSGVTAAGGTLLLTRADGTVTGMDAASGDIEWNRRFQGQPRPYFRWFGDEATRSATTSATAYATAVTDDGSRTRVTAVDPATGEVRWDTELSGTLDLLGAADGFVYFAEGDTVYGRAEAVVRYTPDTGSVRRVTLPVPVDTAQGTVHGTDVHLMGAGGSLVAVDMAAGRQRWRLETGMARGSAPAADGRHVYVTGPDGRLLGVDAREGRLLGQTPPRLGAGDTVPAALPAPVAAGGRVYAGAPDGTVFAVDGRDPAAW
ncbi:serine/threonine-protein kinase [Streptomyces sp. HMX87]|uniref:serine/threonine-protein kinase n=1 Tax=Streptomyces sp. HMX87 TaxID=3390849 RepID=UPI003A88C55B